MEQRHKFFEQILNQYKAKNETAKAKGQVPPGIPILTQSTLRLEQFISATTTSYTFPVLQGEVGQGSAQVLPNEIRLQTNDNFHINQFGIYLAVTANSADTGYRYMTNPNEIFLGSAAAALSYLNLWQGTMNINVNQVDILTNYQLMDHFYVGQTQRLSAAVNNNFDEIEILKNGKVTCSPSLMLSGAYTNTIKINLNGAIASALANSNSRIVIVFEGLRAQNAAIRK